MTATDRHPGSRVALPTTDGDAADHDTIAVLLAREAGYLKTKSACRMLDVEARDLLVMRRRVIEQVFRQRALPLPAIEDRTATSGAGHVHEPAATH